MSRIPVGIFFLQKVCCFSVTNRKRCYKIYVLLFTFLIYTTYHMSRKPFSVVKNVFNQNCSEFKTKENHTSRYWCDWSPFDNKDASKLFGALDSCFLFSYAAAMFISGYLAERSNLRYFLTGGMLLSALSVFLFGLAYWMNIHNFYYFAAVMVFGGIVQTSGWPVVVNCVANWFGKSKRGFIFCLWNAHTSVGNIIGSVIAGIFVENAWGFSFAVPAIIMAGVSILVLLFLTPYPEDVVCSSPDHNDTFEEVISVSVNDDGTVEQQTDSSDDCHDLLRNEKSPIIDSRLKNNSVTSHAISPLGAFRIPGVIEFSLCLFFSKLVSYTFLYWLPEYLNTYREFDLQDSADISTIFDFGGIVGGILAGIVSDMTGGSATICIIMLFSAIPMLVSYVYFIGLSLFSKYVVLFFTGLFVNGPYALITTAVSAELGTSDTLRSNSKALSTVTAIIDGTGSIGAAIGPLMAGFLAPKGWLHVFLMMMISEFIAALLVVRISIKEIKRFMQNRCLRGRSGNTAGS